ncbi:MAG TPA: FtsX-like permease family protein [Terriglobales bacterium]|nr:FtsX-like permease family protein [Terriglobales bacterium]
MRFGGTYLVLAPLWRRRARALLSLAALGLGACLVMALLTLYGGVQRDLDQQFRTYGPDLVVTPAPGAATIPAAAAARALQQFPDSVGVFYAVADHPAMVVAGADLARLRALNSAWHVNGTLVPNQVWLGGNAARLLHLGIGDRLRVTLGGHSADWTIAATVQTGGSEDNQVMAPYPMVAALTGATGYTTLLARVPANQSAIEAAINECARLLPGSNARPLRQIAAGEGAILLSTRSMLVSSTLLILLTVGLCVAAALTTLALERRRDFGLMKALGGSETEVMTTFVGEAAALGLAAGIGGIALGWLLAGVMGLALFGVWFNPSPAGAAFTIAVTVAVAALAALLPWPIVHAAAPAAILRGE